MAGPTWIYGGAFCDELGPGITISERPIFVNRANNNIDKHVFFAHTELAVKLVRY